MNLQLDSGNGRTLSVTSNVIPELLGQPALTAVSLNGTEGIDSLFSYRLVLKTQEALKHLIFDTVNFDTEAWRGQAMSVKIQLDGAGALIAGQAGSSQSGAGIREINGIIDDARFLRVEERYAYYEVTLKPWLHQATLDSDCRIYQNQTVKDIINAALEAFQGKIEWRLLDQYPTRDYTTQFNESTFAFVSRLCETWGISYFFEHHGGKHGLVFTDYMGGYRANVGNAYQTIRFQAHNNRTDEESVHSFVAGKRLTSGNYTTKDFDYTRPRADLSVTKELPEQGNNRQEVYEWHSPHSGHSHYAQPQAGTDRTPNDVLDEGQFLTRIRLAQLHCQGYRAHGSGPLKGMQAGHRFVLRDHPRHAANAEYLILHTTLAITEAAQSSQTTTVSGQQKFSVQVDFEVYPWRGAGEYRPAVKTPIPHMYGLESALVVGPANHEQPGQNTSANPDIWTDQLGRIKVQFQWDRLGQRDQNSSCWIRVCSPWAGNQLGAIHIPRIGQEVLVAFISGNPDLPVCHGRVFNQNNLPPWLLPLQQALSGFRSRELTDAGGNAAGGRSNHLLMDDSAGKLQAQLKSDHQHSQLSLGYITRVEDNQGRKDERGQGFELRTDGHGAMRAKDGLLITTEARSNAASYLSDIDETIQRLNEARELLADVAGRAQSHNAQIGGADQSDVMSAIQSQNQEIGGNGEPHSEFSAAHLLLASPAGIASSTPQSTHLASGCHTQLTSGRHLSMATGGGWFASVTERFAVFVQRCGMKLIAAAGKISIQAQSDEIELVANKVLKLISESDWVDIRGKKGVRLHGGNSTLEVSDQTQFHTPIPVLMNGGLETLLPQNEPQHVTSPPSEMKENRNGFIIQSHGNSGRRYAQEPVQLFKADQLSATGITGNWGEAHIPVLGSTTQYSIKFADGITYPVRASEALDAGKKLANQGWRDHSISHKTSS